MKNRLLRILQEENMTSNKFAELMEVRPSNISHLISGRNYPNFEFIGKMLIRMPNISPDWLINGVGEMCRDAQNDLFGFPKIDDEIIARNVVKQEELDGFTAFDDKDTLTFDKSSFENANNAILTQNKYQFEESTRMVTEAPLDNAEHYVNSNKIDDQALQPSTQYKATQQQFENVAEVAQLDNSTEIDLPTNEQIKKYNNDKVTNVNIVTPLVNTQCFDILQTELPIEKNKIDQQDHHDTTDNSESKLNHCNSTKQNQSSINKMVVFYDDMTFEIYNPK